MKTSIRLAILSMVLVFVWACESQVQTPIEPQQDTPPATSQVVDITPWNEVIPNEEGDARVAKWKEHWKRDLVPQAFTIQKSALDQILKEDVGIRMYYGLSEEAFNKTLEPGNRELDITLIAVRINENMGDLRDMIYTAIQSDGKTRFLDNLAVKTYTDNWRTYNGISRQANTVSCRAEEGCGADDYDHVAYSPSPCGSSYGSGKSFTVPLASAFSRISILEFTDGMAADTELSFSLGIKADNAYDLMLQSFDGPSKNGQGSYLDFSRPCPQGCGNNGSFQGT